MVHVLPDDGNRYELIDGELLVSPAPSIPHQRALIELVGLLRPYARDAGIELLLAPVAILFSPRREVQRNLVGWELQSDRSVPDFREPGNLWLAVETTSPSTVRTDRHRKRVLY
jgi:Uma2 family endonuclease